MQFQSGVFVLVASVTGVLGAGEEVAVGFALGETDGEVDDVVAARLATAASSAEEIAAVVGGRDGRTEGVLGSPLGERAGEEVAVDFGLEDGGDEVGGRLVTVTVAECVRLSRMMGTAIFPTRGVVGLDVGNEPNSILRFRDATGTEWAVLCAADAPVVVVTL